jgi:hypothetical protein
MFVGACALVCGLVFCFSLLLTFAFWLFSLALVLGVDSPPNESAASEIAKSLLFVFFILFFLVLFFFLD